MPTVAKFAAYLERFAPCATAAEWDNVGLLLGDPAAEVLGVMTCLTLSPDVAAEAVAARAELIVAHHPVLFRGVKKLTPASADGRVVLPLLRAGIAVYSPHTAFDNCVGGINDGLCGRLGLMRAVPLRPREARQQYKLVVFVPETDLQAVSDGLFAAGAGVIGQYRECSFRLAGRGTFYGSESTNPTVGQKGRREDVSEWRLEVVVPGHLLTTAVKAMRAAHSYEEPAYDVYPLESAAAGGDGRIGELPQAITLSELAKRAKMALGANVVQVVGDPSRMVRVVAVACGAGGDFLNDAIACKTDVFLTGEVRFHEALAAREANVGLILPGHYATERPGIEDLAVNLAADFPGVAVWASRAERDPLHVLE